MLHGWPGLLAYTGNANFGVFIDRLQLSTRWALGYTAGE